MTGAKAARAVVAGTYRQEGIFMLRTCGLVIAVALLMGACGGGGSGDAMPAPMTFTTHSEPGKSARPMVPTRRLAAVP